MTEKTFNARFIHKHDTAANWAQTSGFIPQKGEIIVYDIDADYNYERLKIGDGNTEVNALPFADGAIKNYIETEIAAISHPVNSVNGQTGAVVLTASDVKADPSGSSVAALSGAKAYTDAEITEWVGDETVGVQISNAIATKSDTGHTHDDRYYTETEIDAVVETKADASDLTAHTGNKSNPHGVTLSQLGVTATSTELNYVDGVTSNIQTQLNAKVPTTRTVNGKALSANITLSASDVGADASGAASTALTSAKSYTDSRITAMVGDDTVANQISSAVDAVTLASLGVTATAAELNYVDGVTSNIQTQLNAKAVSSHTHSSYVNQNAFSNITVGSTTIAADAATDTLTLAGSNVTLTPDATNDKVTIGITKDNGVAALGDTAPTTDTKVTVDTALSSTSTNPVQNKVVNAAITNLNTLVGDTAVATQISNAVATKSDTGHTHSYAGSSSAGGAATSANKLNTNAGSGTQPVYFANGVPVATTYTLSSSVPSGAKFTDTVYTHPTTSGNKHIPSGGSSGQILRWSADGTAVWGSDNNTTYSNATTTTAGLMSAADKTTLNNLTTLVGDTAVATQISNAVSTKADSSHTHSAYVNQNAFSNVVVGSTTVAADSTTDTLTLAGSNVTLTPDATNDKVTIGITKANVVAALGYTPPTTNTTYSAAGSSLGLVQSGGDVTISSGVITVNDDSHNHTIANVDGLETKLNLIGDTAVSTQISNAIATKSDTGHTHDDRYYTESEIDTKLSSKANTSHGNHVPTTGTANNAIFLRNDNTWQTVTPANIGAAASSHGTHVTYSTTAPVMDGTASVGSATTVARSDHKHPTDTSRASASSVTTLQNLVGDTAVATQISNAIASKANTSHTHTISNISNIVISATQPSSPTTGMLWFDIS